MNKLFSVIFGALFLLAAFSACGGIPLVSQNEATETPTRRTLRPTFTPKPKVTATTEIEPTKEPTEIEEVEPTAEPEPETETPLPVVPTKKPAPPQPTNPPAPTVPPAPQFVIKLNSSYLCEQEGVYKVIVNAKNGRTFAGGQAFGIFSQDGRLLQDAAGKNLVGVTQGDINVSIGSNCRVESDFTSPNSSNGELDVGDAIRRGDNPVIFRFVRSAEDLTPLSENLPMNFGQGGQYWIYSNTQ